MFTALALICSLSNPSDCSVVMRQGLYPTLVSCQDGLTDAEAYFSSAGWRVEDYLCVAWGEVT
jgi:hypothetical protein